MKGLKKILFMAVVLVTAGLFVACGNNKDTTG